MCLFIKRHGNKQLRMQLNVVMCSAHDSSRFFSVNPPSSADVSPELSSLWVLLAAHLECPSSPLDPSRSLWCPAPCRWPRLQSIPLALPHLPGGLGDHELSPLETCPPTRHTHNSGVSIQLFISVCGGRMLLHTQQWSLHPALHQCVWREDVTTHTTVESPSSSSSVCVEGGCYYTHNSGVSIQLFISVCGGRV